MAIMATPGQRRYLVRSADSAASLFVVEAKDDAQAAERAVRVKGTGSLFGQETSFVVAETSVPATVPHYLEGYFAMLEA